MIELKEKCIIKLVGPILIETITSFKILDDMKIRKIKIGSRRVNSI